ncbi:MAG: hypothetical protein ED555_13785 [Allomuricauda sp.]|nr:MAG: hypothetical protein ED555_13785 [Allomuricauda sp.]
MCLLKVALVFPNNLYTSPYLPYYTQLLDKENVAYDIISWNRNDRVEQGTVAFTLKNKKGPKVLRILDYFKFRKFALRELEKNNYDKVIVFTCQLGIYLQGYLKKNFPKKYILDIRDYSPMVPYFKNKIGKLIEHAHWVSLSSNGFKSWLPTGSRYMLSHNVNIELVEEALQTEEVKNPLFLKKAILVDTIGQIKDFPSDAEVVMVLGNDARFQLNFIGFGPTSAKLEEFAIKEKIKNVDFSGPYKKEEEKNLLKETDLINILISNNTFNNQVLSNRLYLSALLKIPCMVNDYTVEQQKIIDHFKFGIVIKDYEQIPDEILRFKEQYNPEKFKEACTTFLKEVRKDYELFESNLRTFIGA